MIRRLAVPLAVAAATAVWFVPSLPGPFLNWDDTVNFSNRDFRGLGLAQIRWAFTSALTGHYIPLTRLSYSLNYVLGGLDPWGYHLFNLLLHGANAALFYVVARRLLAAGAGRDAGRALSAAAAVAAIVFGVHPLRVEPVAWITGRNDLLCATFVLLSTLVYLRAVEGEGPARRGPVCLSAGAFAAALLSKGAALPFPVALLVLDGYPLGRWRRLGTWAVVREKIPFFVVTLLGVVAIVYAVRQGAVFTGVGEHGPIARLTLAGYGFVRSAARFVWPFPLSPLYEMPARVSPLEPRFALAIAATLVLTGLLVAARRRWPGGLAAWTFSVLMLAPLTAGLRRGPELVPDRYSYLAGLGFALLVGAAVLGVVGLVRRDRLARPVAWFAAAAGIVVVIGLGATSWSYSALWANAETLWRWAVEADPECAVCHLNLGEKILSGPGGTPRAPEAEALFRRAIALRPDLRQGHFNLGTALMIQGRFDEAEDPLRRYLQQAPWDAMGAERLGRLYSFEKRYAEAVPLLRTAFRRDPDLTGIRDYLAEALRGRAAQLRAAGSDAEAEALAAEARSLQHGAPAPAR